MSRRNRRHKPAPAPVAKGARQVMLAGGSTPKIGAAQIEPESYTVSNWSPQLICSAETMAMNGNFGMAADLCEEMMSDDRLGSVLGKLGLILRLPLQFEPPGGGKPDGDEISRTLAETDWWRMMPEDKAAEFMAWARLLGIGFGHVTDYVEDPVTGRVLPVVEPWSPKHLKREKGTWFANVKKGEGNAQWVEIIPGDGRWIVWTPYSSKRPTHRAPWRALARWWLLKTYARNDWGKHSQKHGMGAFVASPSVDAANSPQDRKDVATALQGIYGSTGMTLPEGWSLDLVESVARTWESFVKQTELADRAMAIAILGQNLSTEVQGGSFAATTAHAAIEAGVLGFIAESFSTLVREQLLVWYVEFNFGDRTKTPWPKWDLRPPKDASARADVLVKVVQAVGGLKSAGLKLAIETLNEEFGFDFEEADEPPPPPPTPPQPPPDPNADPEADPNADPNEDDDATDDPAEPGAFFRLASGGRIQAESGFVQGQLYADAVAERASARFSDALRDTLLGPVLRAMGKANDYDEFRAALLNAYEGADPEDLTGIIEGALKLGQLGGMGAVTQDAPELRNGG